MSQFDDDLEDNNDDYEDDIEPDDSDPFAARKSASNPFSSGPRPGGSGPVPTPNRTNSPLSGGGSPLPRPGMGGSGAPGSGPARPSPSPFGGGSSGSASSPLNRPATPMGGSSPGSPLNRPAAPSSGGSASFGGGSSGSGASPLNRPASPSPASGAGAPPRPAGSPSPSASGSDAGKDKSGGSGLFGSRIGGGSKDDKKDDKKNDKASGGGVGGALGGLGKGLTNRLPGGGGDDKPATPKGTLRTGEQKAAGGGVGGALGGLGKGLTSRLPGRGGDDKPASPTSTGTAPAARLGAPAAPAAPRFGSSGGSNPLGGGAAPAKAATPKAPKAPSKSLSERLQTLSPFRKGTAKPAKQRAPKPVSVTSEGMSLDTKLDILGVALILSALALIFSAISTTQGQLTGGINHFLGQNLGWGAIAAPVTMFAVGVWLILRHFGENAPTLELMTVLGIAILYVGLLVLFQYIDSLNYVVNPNYSYLGQLRLILLPQAYMAGRGGGWVGAEIYYFLVSNLTEIGGFFILVAWMIIGVMLAINISAAQLAMMIISIWRSFNDARRRRAQARAIEAAAQQPVAAPGLPQIAVSRPAAEQLPLGARAAQLPAPSADADEQPIPVMGGRAGSPFRPPEAVPMADTGLKPAVAAATAAPVAARPAETPASGSGGRFGAFASRMRDAIPTVGAKAADNGQDADDKSAKPAANGKAPTDGDKSSGGLFGSLSAKVRDAVPSIPMPMPTPGTRSSDSALKPADAAADASLPTAKPAGVKASAVMPAARVTPATAPAASAAAPAPDLEAEDEAPAKPVGIRASSMFTRPGTVSPAAPTPAPNRGAAKSSPFGFSSDLDDDDEDEPEDDELEDDNTPPERLGNMLRPSAATTSPTPAPTSPANGAAPLPRPGLNRPGTTPPPASGARASSTLPSPFAKPAAPAASTPAPAADEAPAVDPAASTEAPAQPSRPTPPSPFGGGLRPGASSLRSPTPSPIRAAAAPPSPGAKDDVDEVDEDEEEDDIGTIGQLKKEDDKPVDLTPAKPKGVGTFPRPASNNPFNRGLPQTDRGAAIPTPPRPMGTLQERMEALRSGKVTAGEDADAVKPETEQDTPAAVAKATETETQPAATVKPDEAATAPAEPETMTPEVETAPAKAAVPDEDDEPEDKPARAGAGTRRSDDLDSMPTLTQRRPLGINPFTSPRRSTDDEESKPAVPATPAASQPASPASAAPAAFQMPERPKPPTPIKPAGYIHEDAPPPATVPASMKSAKPLDDEDEDEDTPAPPKTIASKRHAWNMPDPGKLLAAGADQEQNKEALRRQGKKIEETLTSFGAPGRVVEIRSGPTITQFGIEPDYLAGRNGKKIRVKVGAIAQLDKDLQLALGARSIRIEAPVPGKGYVGIEVPNAEPSVVRLRDVLESEEFRKVKGPLGIALGQSVDGTPVAADLASMPHLLIAGTTGSGKSVCVNTIVASLLIRNSPERLKFIMVDPKRVELTGYNGIPHLVAPVVVELERIVSVLKWVTREMDERYKKFSAAGARNIEDYNKHLPQSEAQMPYIVVIIDELADLMMMAPDETERVITRIAALARATGIHLVIATQRPSVDVVTGLIKANFPARIAFAVAGGVDSRVILDQPGAEKLLGRGDMLYTSGDAPAPVRLQGVYVSDTEINNITRFWREQTTLEDLSARPIMPPSGMSMDDTGRDVDASAGYGSKTSASRQPDSQAAFWDRELSASANNSGFGDLDDGEGEDGEDAMYDEAVELVRRLNKASVSLLQRRLRIGYGRAARLIDLMEQRGIVGPATEGSKPRDVVG